MSNHQNYGHVMILHRHFLAADRMRAHFDECLAERTKAGATDQIRDPILMNYMFLWYGLTFVLVEGWGKSVLRDPGIGRRISTANTPLLRRCRNAMFHVDFEHYDSDGLHALAGEPGSAAWIRELHDAFSEFFLRWFDAHGVSSKA